MAGADGIAVLGEGDGGGLEVGISHEGMSLAFSRGIVNSSNQYPYAGEGGSSPQNSLPFWGSTATSNAAWPGQVGRVPA